MMDELTKKRRTDLRTEIRNEAAAASALLANMTVVIGDDDEAIDAVIEGETNLKDLIATAIDRIEEIDAFVDAIKSRADQLRSRRDRLERQAGLLRTAVASAMQFAEIDKLELPGHTLTVKMVPPKVFVTDEAAIPSRFFIPQDPKLSLKALSDALKAGEVVPGAALANGGSTLQIRGG